MAYRVLVADDSPTIQKVIKIAFGRHPLEIVETATCIETSVAVTRQRPHLLIIDATLPGTQGPADFKKLQSDAGGCPLVLLIGSYDAVDEKAFRAIGIEHVLKKPFDSSAIVKLVESLLGMPAPSMGTASAPAPPLPGGSQHTVFSGSGSLPPPPSLRPSAGSGEYAQRDLAFAPPMTPPVGRSPLQSGFPGPPPAPATHNDSLPPPPPFAQDRRNPEMSFSLDAADATGPSLELFSGVQMGGSNPSLMPPSRPVSPTGLHEIDAPFLAPPVAPGAWGLGDTPPGPPVSGRADARIVAGAQDRHGASENMGSTGSPYGVSSFSGSPDFLSDDAVPSYTGAAVPSPFDTPRRAPQSFGASEAGIDSLPSQSKSMLSDDFPSAGTLEDLTRDLPELVRKIVEDYCERHFRSLAREFIASELRRLADEKARHLVDN